VSEQHSDGQILLRPSIRNDADEIRWLEKSGPPRDAFTIPARASLPTRPLSMATGWSEPVSGDGVAPAGVQRLSGAHYYVNNGQVLSFGTIKPLLFWIPAPRRQKKTPAGQFVVQADNRRPFLCGKELGKTGVAMRARAENGLRLAAASTLAAVALVLVGRLIVGLAVPSGPTTVGDQGQGDRSESSATKNASNLNRFDPTLRSDRLALSEGAEYKGTGRNIFKMEIPVLRTPPKTKTLTPVPPKTSSPPTMCLRFFGFASILGKAKEIFLSENDDLFIGREGDIINRRYRILQITPTSVEMEDLIDDVRQTLPLDHG
jgi:hypothetical protein